MKRVIFELQLSNMLLLKASFIIQCAVGGNNELITELVVFTDGWIIKDDVWLHTGHCQSCRSSKNFKCFLRIKYTSVEDLIFCSTL